MLSKIKQADRAAWEAADVEMNRRNEASVIQSPTTAGLGGD